jgi:hypothetical protein
VKLPLHLEPIPAYFPWHFSSLLTPCESQISKPRAVTRLLPTLTDLRFLTPLVAALTEKGGEWG